MGHRPRPVYGLDIETDTTANGLDPGSLRSSPSPCRPPAATRSSPGPSDDPLRRRPPPGGPAARRARHVERRRLRPAVPRRPGGPTTAWLWACASVRPDASPCAAPRCPATAAPTGPAGTTTATSTPTGSTAATSARASGSRARSSRSPGSWGLSPVEVDRGRIHDLSNEALAAYVVERRPPGPGAHRAPRLVRTIPPTPPPGATLTDASRWAAVPRNRPRWHLSPTIARRPDCHSPSVTSRITGS